MNQCTNLRNKKSGTSRSRSFSYGGPVGFKPTIEKFRPLNLAVPAVM